MPTPQAGEVKAPPGLEVYWILKQCSTGAEAVAISPAHLVQFETELLGMPEAFSARRQTLIKQFLEAIINVYGSEEAAADALHAYLDSGDLEASELPWPVAEARVVASMALPPGARFRCSIAGLATAGRDARTGQPIQPYTVHLVDAPTFPSAVRLLAESRYTAALNQALGGRSSRGDLPRLACCRRKRARDRGQSDRSRCREVAQSVRQGPTCRFSQAR